MDNLMHEHRQPIIIIGMHRSGTSMVCRLLKALGLFVGWRKDQNEESSFFLNLNRWILHLAGSRWDQIDDIVEKANSEAFQDRALEYIRCAMQSVTALSYLGPSRYVSHRTPLCLPGLWGWKDPRNTLTLPIWLRLYPNAKVIHVHRHGVDTACSLKARYDEASPRWRDRSFVPQFVSARIHKQVEYFRTVSPSKWSSLQVWRWLVLVNGLLLLEPWGQRCSALEGGLTLWAEYEQAAQANLSRCGVEHMTVCYEDLLASPSDHLNELAGFACLQDVSAQRIGELTKSIRSDRAYAYRRDPELVAFATEHKDLLTPLSAGNSSPTCSVLGWQGS